MLTKEEFDTQIKSFRELIDFCYENDCDVCCDIVSNSNLDGIVCSDVSDRIAYEPWTAIRDALNSIEDNSDYYQINGCLNYDALDRDDFEYYKSLVERWCDSYDVFDVDSVMEPAMCDEGDPDDLVGNETVSTTDLIQMIYAESITHLNT